MLVYPRETREATAGDVKTVWAVATFCTRIGLENEPGYVGRPVVIYDYDNAGVLLQNPGLSPKPHQKVDRQTFEAAWAYTTAINKELDAIKK